MVLRTIGKFALTLALAVQLVVATQFATMARAEMVTTDTAVARYAAQADRAFLLEEIQRDEVRAEIVAAGVDPAEAESRLMAMSDAEVAHLVSQIEDGSAGGDAIGSIVGALVTVFIILLVTDLLCLTSVFSWVRCQR